VLDFAFFAPLLVGFPVGRPDVPVDFPFGRSDVPVCFSLGRPDADCAPEGFPDGGVDAPEGFPDGGVDAPEGFPDGGVDAPHYLVLLKICSLVIMVLFQMFLMIFRFVLPKLYFRLILQLKVLLELLLVFG
jgi:hypothetical protein